MMFGSCTGRRTLLQPLLLIAALFPNAASALLREVFTDHEINKVCWGQVAKSPVIVSGGGWLHLVGGCRGAQDPPSKAADTATSPARVIADPTTAPGSELGDPCTHNVCIMKSSRDGGVSWEHFQVLTPKGFDGKKYADCKALFDSKRNKLLVQFAYFPDGTASSGNNVSYYQIESTDHGKRWSDPVDLTPFLTPCFPKADGSGRPRGSAGTRIQTPTGRLLWGAFMLHGSTCVWYSDDGGVTYNATNVHNNGANEVSFVTADTATGLLLMNGRAQHFGSKKERANYYSVDDGSTWSGPQPSGLRGDPDGGCEASLLNINDVLFLFTPSHGGSQHTRSDMVVHCSLDHGKSWPKQYNVTATSVGGYSAMIQVDPSQHKGNSLLLAWAHMNKPSQVYTEIIDTSWC